MTDERRSPSVCTVTPHPDVEPENVDIPECGMCDEPLAKGAPEITWGATRYCSLDCVRGAQDMAGERYIHDDGTVQTAAEFAAEHGLKSRSVLRREAAQKGEPPPDLTGYCPSDAVGTAPGAYMYKDGRYVLKPDEKPCGISINDNGACGLHPLHRGPCITRRSLESNQDANAARPRAAMRTNEAEATPRAKYDEAQRLGPYRVGSKLGRTLYRDDVCIGMVDDEETARFLVGAANCYVQHVAPIESGDRPDNPLCADQGRARELMAAIRPDIRAVFDARGIEEWRTKYRASESQAVEYLIARAFGGMRTDSPIAARKALTNEPCKLACVDCQTYCDCARDP